MSYHPHGTPSFRNLVVRPMWITLKTSLVMGSGNKSINFVSCNCIVTRGGVYDEISRGRSPRDFPRAQAIFHRIPRLESQYSHSQLSKNVMFPINLVLVPIKLIFTCNCTH